MVHKKQEENNTDPRCDARRYLVCQVCGRMVQSEETGSRRQEKAGEIYCWYCRAEMDSCGCSD